jgi:uncharacterized protein
MQKVSIVIDTNVWLSYFLGKHTRAYIDQILIEPCIEIIISENSMQELGEVLNRPKFQKIISKQQIENLLEIIQKRSIFIDVVSSIQLSRDSKDDFLLSLCLDGNADYLLTGDEDLLVLKIFKHTSICKIAYFCELFFN